MKQAFKTILTEQELRSLIRDEVRAVLSNEDVQIAGGGNEGYIDIKQAAEFLKVKTTTVYQYVYNKAIPFHKSGKRVLFIKSELTDWVRTRGKEEK